MAKVLPTRPSQNNIDPDALGRSNTNKDITVNMQAVMDSFQRSHGGLPEKVVEIVNGDLVVDQYAIKVEAQGGADTDEITSITPLLITTDTGNGGAIVDGNYIVLHSDKKITIKHSTAQNGVQTPSGLDVVLSKTPIVLYRNTTGWIISCLPHATDEQMQTLTASQLAFYSANAGQIKTLFSDLNAFFDEKEFTFNSVTDGWYVLDGQNVVLSATQMAKAQSKATSQPELFKTEAEWQALSTAYGGVGGVTYFVLDTVGGTLRLPDLRGMYAQSKETAREVFEAGLPNILGSFSGRTGAVSGAFIDTYLTTAQSGLGIGLATISFDASRSNATYGNSATVTPNTYTTVKCVYLGV